RHGRLREVCVAGNRHQAKACPCSDAEDLIFDAWSCGHERARGDGEAVVGAESHRFSQTRKLLLQEVGKGWHLPIDSAFHGAQLILDHLCDHWGDVDCHSATFADSFVELDGSEFASANEFAIDTRADL